MTEDLIAEQRALLTRAADIEARRQAARRAHNVEHEQRLHDELRRVWERYGAIESAA